MAAQPSQPRVLIVRASPDPQPDIEPSDAPHGAGVSVAESAEEAVDLYRRIRADLVLLGLRGCEPDALALIARLRAADPEALVVVAGPSDAAGVLRLFGGVEEAEGGAAIATAIREAAARRRAQALLRRIAALASEGRHDTAIESARALNNALEARDPATGGHSERVTRYAEALLARLDLDDASREQIRLAAQLHDIGKIGVRDDVLMKAARLTPEEQAVMRVHPLLGAQILEPLSELAEARLAVRHHHERWDGKGYPDGLAGEEIPLGARALFIADAFDAITSDRVYSLGRNVERGLAEIARCAGSQFDPELARLFVEAMEAEGPA